MPLIELDTTDILDALETNDLTVIREYLQGEIGKVKRAYEAIYEVTWTAPGERGPYRHLICNGPNHSSPDYSSFENLRDFLPSFAELIEREHATSASLVYENGTRVAMWRVEETPEPSTETTAIE